MFLLAQYCILNEVKTDSGTDTAVVRSLYMKRKSRDGGKICPEKRVTHHHHHQPLPLPPRRSCTYSDGMHTHIHLSRRRRRFRNIQRAMASNGLARAENHFSHTFSFFSAT